MGKTIKIYLANENAAGIRHVEIANWSGQALACPRARFQELSGWPEVQRPGVYFLFGVDDKTSEEAVYIGEAEVVVDRLVAHMSGKEFWTEVVTFTSKDENLTKAHVRYLESRLVTMTKSVGRYKITNGSSPQLPLLPRSDRDAMEDFIISIQMLLGVLGHKVLDPLVINPRVVEGSIPISDQFSAVSPTPTQRLLEKVDATLPAFRLQVSDLTAYAMRTDEGIVVLAGTEVSLTAKPSLTGGLLARRLALIDSGIIVEDETKLVFARNYLFRSPSQAAGVIVGYSINGREYWRLPDGTSWGKFELNLSLAGKAEGQVGLHDKSSSLVGRILQN